MDTFLIGKRNNWHKLGAADTRSWTHIRRNWCGKYIYIYVFSCQFDIRANNLYGVFPQGFFTEEPTFVHMYTNNVKERLAEVTILAELELNE